MERKGSLEHFLEGMFKYTNNIHKNRRKTNTEPEETVTVKIKTRKSEEKTH